MPPSGSPTAGPSDEAILTEIGGGHLERFDAFVDRYKRPLIRFFALRLGDIHAAEDLSQEVFLRVFRSAGRHGFKGGGAASTWIFTIASNCATDYLRSRRRRRLQLAGSPHDEAPFGSLEPTARGNLEEDLDRVERERRLEDVVGELEDELREILALRVYGGLSFAEAAEVIGCPISTAKSRMQRALQVLRRLFRGSERSCHD